MEFISAFGNWCGGPGYWAGGGSGWTNWMPFHFGGIFQLLIIGLIIYFIARMFRNRPAANGPTPSSSLEILNRRYANGEIDKDTYTTMKDDLNL